MLDPAAILAEIDQLINRVPDHYIVEEQRRTDYLKGLLDAKGAVLELYEQAMNPAQNLSGSPILTGTTDPETKGDV